MFHDTEVTSHAGQAGSRVMRLVPSPHVGVFTRTHRDFGERGVKNFVHGSKYARAAGRRVGEMGESGRVCREQSAADGYGIISELELSWVEAVHRHKVRVEAAAIL